MPWDYTHAKDLRTEMAFKECAVLNMTTITMFLKKKRDREKTLYCSQLGTRGQAL